MGFSAASDLNGNGVPPGGWGVSDLTLVGLSSIRIPPQGDLPRSWPWRAGGGPWP